MRDELRYIIDDPTLLSRLREIKNLERMLQNTEAKYTTRTHCGYGICIASLLCSVGTSPLRKWTAPTPSILIQSMRVLQHDPQEGPRVAHLKKTPTYLAAQQEYRERVQQHNRLFDTIQYFFYGVASIGLLTAWYATYRADSASGQANFLPFEKERVLREYYAARKGANSIHNV